MPCSKARNRRRGLQLAGSTVARGANPSCRYRTFAPAKRSNNLSGIDFRVEKLQESVSRITAQRRIAAAQGIE